MARVAVRAESLGFESVRVPEHLVFPTEIRSRYPYSPSGIPPIRVDAPHLDPQRSGRTPWRARAAREGASTAPWRS